MRVARIGVADEEYDPRREAAEEALELLRVAAVDVCPLVRASEASGDLLSLGVRLSPPPILRWTWIELMYVLCVYCYSCRVRTVYVSCVLSSVELRLLQTTHATHDAAL